MRAAFLACEANAERLAIIAEIRDSLEQSQGADYASFVRAFCKPLLRLLQTVPPMHADAPEQRLRMAALEVCSRCVQCHPSKPLAFWSFCTSSWLL